MVGAGGRTWLDQSGLRLVCARRLAALAQYQLAWPASTVRGPAFSVLGQLGESRTPLHAGDVPGVDCLSGSCSCAHLWGHSRNEALAERRIAHAKFGPDMFGEQLDRIPVHNRVALCQISHGLNQNFLSVNISRVGRALTRRFAGHIWGDGNSKYLGHVSPGSDGLDFD